MVQCWGATRGGRAHWRTSSSTPTLHHRCSGNACPSVPEYLNHMCTPTVLLPSTVFNTCGPVEGVGIGAQAAAAKHGTFDLTDLAKWQAGSPVPFGFIAQTFEAVACESKRLIITQLLVSPASRMSYLTWDPCDSTCRRLCCVSCACSCTEQELMSMPVPVVCQAGNIPSVPPGTSVGNAFLERLSSGCCTCATLKTSRQAAACCPEIQIDSTLAHS